MNRSLIAVAVAAVLGAGAVSGQEFPNKPIRIVAAQPGGSTDFIARLIAQGLTSSLGWQVIVENRGGGVLPGIYVSKALPDGYTLLVATGVLWTGPLLQKVNYNPVKDFSPITLVSRQPNILAVHPSLPVKSIKELIALAKARPGELNYGFGGLGGSNHLSAELFKAMARINMVGIPYKGSGPALSATVGGEVQLIFATAGSAVPHVTSGRLRALAVTSAEPSPLAPGLPTVAASGLPGYESSTTTGMHAPARTPATIINRLNQEIVRILDQPDVKEKFFNVGIEAVSSSPEKFAATTKSEMARIGKVIKDAGIRAD